MKSIRVLGSGDAFHEGGRAHSSYLLESSGGDLLLLDFGATALLSLQRMQIDAGGLDALLLTHLHGDHLAGIPFLLLYMDAILKRTRPFTIFCPGECENRVRSLMELCYPGHTYHYMVVFRPVREIPFRYNSFEIWPYPVTHTEESLGYRISGPKNRTVAFSGDSAFDSRLLSLVDGVDLAILEASLVQNTDPPMAHVSVAELRKGRAQLRAKAVRFTHMGHASARALEEIWPGSTLQDGMCIDLESMEPHA